MTTMGDATNKMIEMSFNLAASLALLFAGTSHAVLQRPSVLVRTSVYFNDNKNNYYHRSHSFFRRALAFVQPRSRTSIDRTTEQLQFDSIDTLLVYRCMSPRQLTTNV